MRTFADIQVGDNIYCYNFTICQIHVWPVTDIKQKGKDTIFYVQAASQVNGGAIRKFDIKIVVSDESTTVASGQTKYCMNKLFYSDFAVLKDEVKKYYLSFITKYTNLIQSLDAIKDPCAPAVEEESSQEENKQEEVSE